MRCELRILYCATGKVPDRALGTVAMPSLLHELIERATQRGYLDPAHDRDARLLAVMHDELAALTDAKTAFTAFAPSSNARLIAAVVALVSGASVTETALACGYSSLSAFINAYRTLLGTTPGRMRL